MSRLRYRDGPAHRAGSLVPEKEGLRLDERLGLTYQVKVGLDPEEPRELLRGDKRLF